MLKPEEYTLIGEALTGLFQDLEDFVIMDFVRRIKNVGTITETAKWQVLRAKEMGLFLENLENAVKAALEISDEELAALFNEWGIKAAERENELAKEAGVTPVTIDGNEELQRLLEGVKDQTQNELINLTGSLGFATMENGKMVFNKTAEYFQRELDFVQLQVQSGVLDYNSAIRQSVKRMADSGLRTVDYASGWSNHLDVAVRRATLTGANQMSGKLTDALGEEMGCNHVEVTAHAGARNTGKDYENHKNWQGKVYCRQGETKEYPNLERVTGFGRGGGLKGWGCRHDYNNFWPGASERAFTDEELENIDPDPFTYKGKEYDFYAANQRQRYIERSIRRSKRELIGHETSGDDEAFTTESIRLQRQRKEYRDFSKAAGLREKPERHRVYGFDQKISKKAVKANAKHSKDVAKKQQDDIIKSEIKAIGIRGDIDLSPKKINVDDYAFDEEHVNKDRNHNVSFDEAKQFIADADISVTRWGGQFINYYGVNGSTYVDVKNNIVKTAFKKSEYGGRTQELMEVLKKWRK